MPCACFQLGPIYHRPSDTSIRSNCIQGLKEKKKKARLNPGGWGATSESPRLAKVKHPDLVLVEPLRRSKRLAGWPGRSDRDIGCDG